ncbi:hypothetical protein AK812_SmicGene48984, partial [Symbiodinium microadriaticum]
AYEDWRIMPAVTRGDLRARQYVDLSKSDREIFAALPSNDLWLDSRIHEVFLYLYRCKKVELLD